MLGNHSHALHKRLIIVAIILAIVAVGTVLSLRSAKKRAESVACGNYMVAIGFAARMWANDHDEKLPTDLLTMSNELNSPKVLHCPGDRRRQRVGTWAEFTDANSSYEVHVAGRPRSRHEHCLSAL